MPASFYGELVVRFVGDTRSVEAANKRVAASTVTAARTAERTWAQSAAKVGLAMQNVGRTFTQYFSVPVAAGLGYAAYAAYNYQKAMLQVKNLTGLTTAEAQHFSKAVREASAEIGNTGGPQAAAEAYYFLASSGLNAKEAFDALKVAMKANVAGMGDIQVTSDVVSSALNVYRKSGLSAADAMDILMRTIEVGKAEPEALSRSLGRVMPIANQLGVDLAELGGTIAALTLGGLSSAEAVTSLRGTMVALASPARQSIDEMKTLGTSYQEVTRSIRERGLIQTVKELWELTDHNMLAMRRLIPNVRATAGVMSLLGDNYERNLKVIARVNDYQGKLNETYNEASKSDVAQFNKALNKLKNAFIEVGVVVLPLVTDLVKSFGRLVGAFSRLSPAIRSFAVNVTALAVAFFPLLSIIGSITRGVSLMAASMAASRVATQISSIGAAASTSAAELTALSTTTGTLFAGLSLGHVLGIAGAVAAVAAAIYGLHKAVEAHKRSQLRLKLQPKVLSDTFDKEFDKEMERGGFKKVVVDGVVYYNYEVKAKQKGGEGAAGKTLQSQVVARQERENARLDYLAKEAEKIASRIRGTAVKAGGRYSLAALLGLDVGGNLYRELAIRPKIEELTKEIEELEARRTRLLTGYRIGGRGPIREAALREAESLQTLISFRRETLANQIRLWDETVGKMRKIEDMEPSWRLRGGMKAIREQARQYLFDIREYLGKPMKVPRIDLSVNVAKLRDQLADVSGYLKNLTRSRYIDISVKKERVKSVIAAIEKELDRVRVRMAREGPSVELKAKKEALERALREANGKLTALDRLTAAPTVKIAGKDRAVRDVQAVRDALSSLHDKTVTVRVNQVGSARRSWGGIIRKPEVTLVGEDGPEVIIPLTQPKRAAELVRESGLARFTEPKVRAVPVAQRAMNQDENVRMADVHYHTHLALPQGIVVSDIERFGRMVQPYVERGTILAQRRRARGEARL